MIDEAWSTGKPIYLVVTHSNDDNFKYDQPDMAEKGAQDATSIMSLKIEHPNLDGVVIGDFFTDVSW